MIAAYMVRINSTTDWHYSEWVVSWNLSIDTCNMYRHCLSTAGQWRLLSRNDPGSKLFDTVIVFLKEFFEKVYFEKVS